MIMTKKIFPKLSVLILFLSAAALGLGYLWVAFDDRKQTWHDKIAGTVVLRGV